MPQRFEARDRLGGRCRAQRRAKSLVAALVEIYRGDDVRVERVARLERNSPIIGERCINSQAAARDLAGKTPQPIVRDEVEQRGGRDQIQRRRKSRFEVAGNVVVISVSPTRAGRDATACRL